MGVESSQDFPRLSRRRLFQLTGGMLLTAAVVACGPDPNKNEYVKKYLSLQPDSQVDILDATVLFTQVRRRSYPQVIIPSQTGITIGEQNIVYTTEPNQVEVVERPFIAKISDVNWLMYYPPNDLTSLACVAVDQDTDDRMKKAGESQSGVLRFLSGAQSKVRQVTISDVERELIGCLQRPAVYYSENGTNLRLARSTIIQFPK